MSASARPMYEQLTDSLELAAGSNVARQGMCMCVEVQMTKGTDAEISAISAKQEALQETLQQATELTATAQRALARRKSNLRNKSDQT